MFLTDACATAIALAHAVSAGARTPRETNEPKCINKNRTPLFLFEFGIFHIETLHQVVQLVGYHVFLIPVLIRWNDLPWGVVAVIETLFVHMQVFVTQLGFIMILWIILPHFGRVFHAFVQSLLLLFG